MPGVPAPHDAILMPRYNEAAAGRGRSSHFAVFSCVTLRH